MGGAFNFLLSTDYVTEINVSLRKQQNKTYPDTAVLWSRSAYMELEKRRGRVMRSFVMVI